MKLLNNNVHYVLSIICVIASANVTLAQCQKMAIPGGSSFEISPGSSRTVNAFCLDQARRPPSSSTRYRNVLTQHDGSTVEFEDGLTMSLQEAIAKEKIEITGRNLNFSDLVEMSEHMSQSAVPPETINRLRFVRQVLNSLAPSDRELTEGVLDSLFTPTSLQLGDYTKLVLINKSSSLATFRFRKTTVVGETAESLPGVDLSSVPLRALLKSRYEIQAELWIRQLKEKLSVLGYYKGSIDGQQNESLSQAIRRFQKDRDLKVSDDMDKATLETLDDTVNKIANDLSGLGFKQAKLNDALLSYQTHSGLPETAIYDEKLKQCIAKDLLKKKKVLTIAESEHTASSYKGANPADDEFATMDRLNDQTYVLLKHKGDTELWIVKGRDIQQRLKGEDAIELLDDIAAKKVKSKSDINVSFLHAKSFRLDDNYIGLTYGETDIRIKQDEFNKFLRGDSRTTIFDNLFGPKAKKGKDKTKVVVWRDAFVQGKGRAGEINGYYHMSRRHIDPLIFCKELQRRYGEYHEFYLDDEMDTGKDNAQNIPEIATDQGIGIYLGEKTDFEVKDFGVIEQTRNILAKSSRIQVMEGFSPFVGKNVIVITGHKDDAGKFYKYVETLSRNGCLEGKLVVLFSCYRQGDENFNSLMITNDSGARAILFFSQEIDPQAVYEVLVSLEQKLEKAREKPADFKSLMDECIDASKSRNQHEPDLQKEIEKIRDGIIQVSYLAMPVGSECSLS